MFTSALIFVLVKFLQVLALVFIIIIYGVTIRKKI